MSKKIISIVLFAAMLLSMVTVANAVTLEEKPTGVAYVTVANLYPSDMLSASVNPPGGPVGVMIPSVSRWDMLTITGSLDTIYHKDYDVAIVFNGKLDATKNHDAVSINGKWLDLTKAENYAELDNGNSVVYTTFSIGKNMLAPMTIYDRTYQVKVVKDTNKDKEAITFEYEFTIQFIDAPVASYELLGVYTTNYDTLIGEFAIGLVPRPSSTEVKDGTSKPQQLASVKFTPAVAQEEIIVVPGAAPINAIVNVNSRLNVRTAPSASSAIVTKLPAGSAVCVLAYNADWTLIGSAAGVPMGYVYTKYITLL